MPLSTYSVEELKSILAEGGRDAEAARERILARMGDLPAFMRELKQRFSIWFNHQHGTKGENKGKVQLQELLRVRVRYFGDGLALGSRAFMTQVLRDHREMFGSKRRQAGTPLPETSDDFVFG